MSGVRALLVVGGLLALANVVVLALRAWPEFVRPRWLAARVLFGALVGLSLGYVGVLGWLWWGGSLVGG